MEDQSTTTSSAPNVPERNTRQRQAIRDVIADAGVPLSPKEILAQTRQRIEGLGMATVYRTLKMLAESGIITTVDIPGESPRFELQGKGHHHHFYCRGCEKVYEVEGCPGDFTELTPRDFSLEGHELVLFGQCATCHTGKGGKRAGKGDVKGRSGSEGERGSRQTH